MSLSSRLTKNVQNYANPNSLGSKMRSQRTQPLIAMIERSAKANGRVDIVDLGGRKSYWTMFPEEVLVENKVHITFVNIPGENSEPDDERFTFLTGDACNLTIFEDNQFHIAHSNSVLEHVGDWDKMVQFAGEVKRIAPSYFVQTPNYWFPVEPHFMTPLIHWLPKPWRVRLIRSLALGNWEKQHSVDSAVRAVESARLLNKHMFRGLFEEAEIVTERMLYLPKSFIAVRSTHANV